MILLVALRVSKPGVATVDGLRIYYVVGGDRFQTLHEATPVFCPRTCPKTRAWRTT